MFNHHTLFILGAGASYEAGLPIGKGLAEAISAKLDIRFALGNKHDSNGDFDLFYQVTNNLRDHTDEYQSAGWLIRDGMIFARSIDDFLDMHRENSFAVKYGKAAIVRTILQAERNSNLFFQPGSDRPAFTAALLQDSWFIKFAQLLGANIPVKDISTVFDRVSFINFNYDRVLEFFLTQALQLSHGIGAPEAAAVVERLDIIHPYGVIDPTIAFGAGRADYVALAGNIRTYTEQIDDPALLNRLAEMISKAHRIVFLGFAYHNQNMNLLRPTVKLAPKEILGTGLGLSGPDVAVVQRQITSMWSPSYVEVVGNCACARLFDDYAKTLTA